MSKKKAKDIEKERGAFVHGDPERDIIGCVANGIPASVAESIYDEINDFANYAFNKAHAVCYAVVAYQTAWFKRHHPREYMAALLTSVLYYTEKISEYINECRDMGITVLPPDINRSFDNFTVEDTSVRFGLVAIKNIGRSLIQSMVRERADNGLFTSFQDFCERMYCHDINKRAVENLIRAGAFDCFGVKRSQLVAIHDKLLDSIANSRRQNVEGQLDFFNMPTTAQSSRSVGVELPNIPEFSNEELMRQEREVTGLYLSGHPVGTYREIAKRAGAVRIASINEDFAREGGPVSFCDEQNITVVGVVTAYKTKTTRTNGLMAYVTVEDETASMELLCFSRMLDKYGTFMKEGSVVLVQGKLSVRDEKPPQILCDAVYPLVGHAGLPEEPQQAQIRTGVQVLNGKALWLRVPSASHPVVPHINRVINMFPGKTPARLVFSDTGKRMGTACLLGKSLVDELVDVLGKENVVVESN